MSVLLLAGSPSSPSRSTALLDAVADRLARRGIATDALAVRELPAAALLAADTSHHSVQLAVDRLDDLAQDLDIVAERLSGDENNILYHFRVEHAGNLLLSGRAAVMLVAQPESSPA